MTPVFSTPALYSSDSLCLLELILKPSWCFWGTKWFGSSALHILSIILCLLTYPEVLCSMPSKCPQNCHKGNGKCWFYCVCLQVMELVSERQPPWKASQKHFTAAFDEFYTYLNSTPTSHVILNVSICCFYFAKHHWICNCRYVLALFYSLQV